MSNLAWMKKVDTYAAALEENAKLKAEVARLRALYGEAAEQISVISRDLVDEKKEVERLKASAENSDEEREGLLVEVERLQGEMRKRAVEIERLKAREAYLEDARLSLDSLRLSMKDRAEKAEAEVDRLKRWRGRVLAELDARQDRIAKKLRALRPFFKEGGA